MVDGRGSASPIASRTRAIAFNSFTQASNDGSCAGKQRAARLKSNALCFVSSDSDVGMPCGKTAVVKCCDCGASICSDCRTWCCGQSFCELCYDYHLNSCLRK